MEEYGHFINGEWIKSEATITVFDKYTGAELGRVGRASRRIVSQAIESASTTFYTKKLSTTERYNILMRTAEIIKERKSELSNILIAEVGKVKKDADAEVDRAVQTFIASAEEAKRIAGTGIPLGQPGNENKMAFTVRVPVGVVVAITPFNFPLNLTAHKLGPALAAGNAVVLKPTQQTPIIACKLTEILTEAGLPAGWLNLVNGKGSETGEYLLEDERISLFTFTGSPQIGRQIKSKTGIRKVALELGNNSPNIIYKDAPDLDKAVELCITRGFSNAGQACIAVQRIYVHQEVYDTFLEKAVQVTESLKVGNPESETTDIGPMISISEAERAETWIRDAEKNGAKIITGGRRDEAILEPTILVDVKEDMKVVCEEIFAPVISIIPFDDIEEAFNLANNSNMGLQVGIFTSDINLAMQATQKLHFGGVIINDVSTFRADVMPYGGVKDSGIGKEGPHFALKEMTDEKLVVINL
ncbi:aldehyde dehydrogenase family protein [Pseudogracilibacillus sp. SE30717A]|uniref:aldehyde dehydrogenase family protein n=1 Tax=Pseudogracilibacillus sp. SE30717A TaxID=3098293 RepID=UPI00300DF4D1